MPTIFDYLKANQYDSFYDKDFTVLDALALTELAYLPFEDLVPAEISVQNYISLQHLAEQFEEKFQGKYPPLGMVNAHRLKLLSYLSSFKRYKHIRALGFANDVSLDSQKQFAAITYQIRPKEYLVVFRGTDDSIIGWKEDFHLTYMKEIPAQLAARDYLKEVLDKLDSKVWLAGHSKGGNLATYAACHVETSIQDRVQKVYSFDAPGLHSSIRNSDNFKAIEGKILSIIPENSIVGMMLETPETDLVVKSKTFGLLQHLMVSWEIEGDQFKVVPKVTEDSIQVDQTLKSWTASLSEEELRDFFDLFFGLFIEAGIYRFGDITVDTPVKIQKLIENRRNLTPEQATMMDRLSRQLIDTRIQVWKDSLPDLPKLTPFKLPDHFQEKLPKFDELHLTDKIRSLIPDKPKDEA
ncbi:Mbeg1-like protein [Streptococcus sp.]|uniref:Mbeg1-like protein n=1 Tax=Streptococcus sp. TaxID=1306 RepID=UPI00391CD5AF